MTDHLSQGELERSLHDPAQAKAIIAVGLAVASVSGAAGHLAMLPSGAMALIAAGLTLLVALAVRAREIQQGVRAVGPFALRAGALIAILVFVAWPLLTFLGPAFYVGAWTGVVGHRLRHLPLVGAALIVALFSVADTWYLTETIFPPNVVVARLGSALLVGAVVIVLYLHGRKSARG